MEFVETLKKIYYERISIPFTYRRMRKYHIENSYDTIQYIINHRASICRFGDGEFSMIFGEGNGFQEYNKQLSERLLEILSSNNSNVLIGIPRFIVNLENANQESANFWGYYTCLNYKRLNAILSEGNTYYDSLITRFYNSYQNKKNCEKHLEHLREIWLNRDICIVEGSLTRSGIGNNLFDNSSSVIRILCPAKNAFSRYNEIIQCIKNIVPKDCLILISLGMTATVMAYDLAKDGYQAIDLGHLDIEYEWFKSSSKWKTAIPGKYVNEAMGGNVVGECNDLDYKKQIIAEIC